MVTSTFATPATATVAGAAARALIDGFGCSFVRVWLGDGFGLADPIVTIGGRPDDETKLRPETAARAIADGRRSLEPMSHGTDPGPTSGGYRICIPLCAGGVPFGCVECYTTADVTFDVAAKVEARLAPLADELAATSSVPKGESRTILVIEHHASRRDDLTRVLVASGFAAYSVDTGLEAADTIARRAPDLILVDYATLERYAIDMPSLLRCAPRGDATPVVMIVDAKSPAERVAGLEAGADDIVAFPAEPRELVSRLRNMLRWVDLLGAGEGENGTISTRRIAPSPNESLALYESRHGNLEESLDMFVRDAEACEVSQRFDGAARAYRGAALAARDLRREDVANKFMRLAGKMYLTFAETTTSAQRIEKAYLAAAKCFLDAGNMNLASKALELAASFESLAQT